MSLNRKVSLYDIKSGQCEIEQGTNREESVDNLPFEIVISSAIIVVPIIVDTPRRYPEIQCQCHCRSATGGVIHM